MKKIFILMALLPVILFGQEQNIYNGTSDDEFTDVAMMTAGDSTFYSDAFMPFRVNKTFNGLLGLALDVDNIVGTNEDPDSLTFYIQHNLAGNWITGTIIPWNALSETAVAQDAEFSTTQTVISPQSADSAKTFVYILDPSAITNIKGYPTEEYRIRVDTNDSLGFHIRLDWNQY